MQRADKEEWMTAQVAGTQGPRTESPQKAAVALVVGHLLGSAGVGEGEEPVTHLESCQVDELAEPANDDS